MLTHIVMAYFDFITGVPVAYPKEERKAIAAGAAVKLQVKVDAVVGMLAAITALLALLSLGGTCIKFLAGYDTVLGTTPKFNMDTEGNIPTFFSALLLVISGGLFLIIARYKRNLQDAFSRQWALLSLIFLYMAVDEATEIHGLATVPLNKLGNFGGVLHFSWIIIGLVLLVVCGLYFLRLFISFSPLYKRMFLGAAFVYFSGLVGMEMIGGAYADIYGEANITYELLTTVEETLEMTGLVLLIRVLLLYMQRQAGSITFSINPGSSEQL